jgi:gliding motility-associated-like protein
LVNVLNTATSCYQSLTGSATITVNPVPTVLALPNNQTVCSGQSTGILLTETVPGTTFNWTVAQNGATGALIANGTIISQVLTTTGVATGSVDYTITPTANGCVGTPTTVTVLVAPIPTVVSSLSAQTICSGTAPSISLSGTVAGTSFNWNVVQTNVTGASANTGNSIAQVLTTVGNKAGEAVYSIIPNINGCQGLPILATITVNPIPVATANPSLTTICSGNNTSIALTSNVAGTTFSWASAQVGVDGANAGIGDAISQTLTTSGLVSGTVDYTITPSFKGCVGIPIVAKIKVNPTPEVFGSTGSTLCSGEYTNILLSPNIPGTQFAWTVVQTGVRGATDGTGDTISQMLEAGTILGTAVYTVTPTLNACSGNAIQITINVNPAPTPAIAEGVICVDANGTTLQSHTFDTNLSMTDYTFEWYYNAALIPGAVGSSYEATKDGNYSVIATNSLTSCTSKEAFANIIANNPAVSLDAVVTDAFTQDATIIATVTGGTGPFLYQIDGGVFQSSNVFSGLSSGIHTINVKDAEGCTNLTKQVTVIDYPKYFTPNGDGFNDSWNISGLSNQPDAKIFIYDRYGKLIKEMSTVGSGWDGTYNGKALPATDYWFTVEYAENNGNKLFKAHFGLKR